MAKKPVKRAFKKEYMGFTKTDPILFNIVLVLVCFGLIMCFSASAPTAQVQNGDSYYFLKRQMIWAIGGFIAMIFTSNFNYNNYKKYSFMIYAPAEEILLCVQDAVRARDSKTSCAEDAMKRICLSEENRVTHTEHL